MSFQQGLSGLNAASRNLQVIGNNIANGNTYGAKGARAEFADVYANAVAGNPNQVGIGVQVAAVAQQFTQGDITDTGNALDIAISGNGFFQVSSPSGAPAYTRNGQFKVDAATGFIVNNQGQRLLGYPADPNGVVIPGTAGPLVMPTASIAPRATTTATMEMNLDSRQAVTLPSAGVPIDFNDPTTYNNATSQNVYDVQGNPVALTYYFQKSASNTWNVYVTANGIPLATSGGNPAPSTTITFPANGSAPTAPVGPVALDVPSVTNAVGSTTVPITGIQLDLSRATQYGSAYGVTDLGQNGHTAGQLTGINIGPNGVISAQYSNHQTRAAGQIELANFRNPQSLTPIGGNAWIAGIASGDPIVGAPGSGNLGVLQSEALEESNIDITEQLVDMITAQRAYQANAQTIKTQDQIMQTIVNLR